MDILKIAYFDCFSGISGDMCLGSLVDAGVSLKALGKELRKIPVMAYRLSSRKVRRAHLAACKVDVVEISKTKNRKVKLVRWEDIEALINGSSLSGDIKQKGLGIFRRIFEAEARAHGETFRNVHLHELGAVDCLIDVFGTLIALNMLGVREIFASPINLGSGFVKTDTGILPVPAPATAHILKNVPVYSKMISTELTTPTGAAIIRELSAGFGDIPGMDIEKIGVGAGDRDFENWPNVLRLFVGSTSSPPPRKGRAGAFSHDTVTVIETNIDDMNPQIFEYVMEQLFKAGALDAYITSIIMKKGRPAFKLTVLCSEDRREPLIRIIFEETSTIGLRFYEAGRKTLMRKIRAIDTEFGRLRVKVSSYGDKILKQTPEYEDCKKIAKRLKIPLINITKKIT
jgi:hypothetical protein